MGSAIKAYPLTGTPRTAVTMPPDAQLVAVLAPNDTPTLWVRVDPDATSDNTRAFWAYATDALLPDGFGAGPLTYVGTYCLANGDAFHVFERSPDAT